MASNPIQRRARQSFLVGFLLALILMAVVVFFLFTRISSLNTELEDANARLQPKTVYVASQDIESGEVITQSMLTEKEVSDSTFDVSSYIDIDFLYGVDDDGNEIQYVAKVPISAGSLITGSMVQQSDDVRDDSDRIVEYNMISLPSQLKNGEYVDVRISFPDGTSYIVLSKKYVEQTTDTGIWFTMSEIEILTMENAIVETYIIEGARLYAVVYAEPGIQDAAIANYAVSDTVRNAIQADANIVDEAKSALAEKMSTYVLKADDGKTSDWKYERSIINGYLSLTDSEDRASAVESGNQTENATIAEDREEFVTELDGTGIVGTDY